MTIRELHDLIGLETVGVIEPGGVTSATAFLVRGIYVRIVGALVAIWTLIFRRDQLRGVLVVGANDAEGVRAPVAILDWETYSRLAMGLRTDAALDARWHAALQRHGTSRVLETLDELDDTAGGEEHESGGSY